MSYIHYPRRRTLSQEQGLKWLIYLFLGLTFFVTVHDTPYVQRSLGDYNRTEDDIVENVQGGNAGRQLALLALGAAAVLSFVSYSATIRLRPDGVTSRLLLAFVSWSALSVVWADDHALACKRLAAFAILCMVAFAIVRMFSFAEIAKWTFFVTATSLIIAISLETASGAFRPWLSDYRFSGTQHPNGEGIECGLLCLSGIVMAQLDGKRSRWYLASAAVGGIFLFFTHSRTALIATILGLGVTFLLRGSRTSKKIVLSAALISGLCALMLLGAGLLPSVKNALSSERDGDFSVGTFSGRTEIWQDVEPYILARPLIGHGYLSFWTPAHIAEISDLEQWGVPDSHSAYIDYLLTLGAVGLTLYLLCLGQGLRKAFQLSRSYRNNEAGFMGAIVVFGLVDGFFESSIGEGSMLMFLCIIALTWIAFAAEDTPPSALLNREPGAEPDRTAHV